MLFHDLRHTFASLKAAQGYSAREVSAWMGHGSVSFTLDTYTHLFPVDDDLRNKARRGLPGVNPGDQQRDGPPRGVVGAVTSKAAY